MAEEPVYTVSISQITFEQLVIMAEGGEQYYKDPWIYEFSNGRRFLSGNASDGGIYDGT